MTLLFCSVCAVPSEKLLQVVGEVGTPSIARVHSDEDCHVRVDFHSLADDLYGNDL